MHAKWSETLWCRMYWAGLLLCRRNRGSCQVVSQAADVCISWPFAAVAATPCPCCRNLGTHYIGHSSLLNSVLFCIQHEISLVLCCHFSFYLPYYHIKCLMRQLLARRSQWGFRSLRQADQPMRQQFVTVPGHHLQFLRCMEGCCWHTQSHGPLSAHFILTIWKGGVISDLSCT